MLHSRTYTEVDDEVLRCITGAHYKVLRYLVNRADPAGRYGVKVQDANIRFIENMAQMHPELRPDADAMLNEILAVTTTMVTHPAEGE